jgi:ferredoxin-NADP reductase
MLKDLVSQAELSYRLLGRVEFPRSMMDAIGAELWKMGLPEVRQHLERYTKDLLQKAEQKARRNPRTDAPKDLLHNVRTASEPR